MILPIAFNANWAYIRKRKQDQVESDNIRENANRIPHTYKVGDKVLYKVHGISPKLDKSRRGPYEVTKVYNNGTIQIQRGVVSERVNMRHLTPFFE
jgi:hypothetical protein